MNTYSSPSAYRYCIVRLSTVAVSTLVPALKVLSTTLPDSTFFRVVRTNAPPLPGLTCWNSTTDHSSPSRLRTKPFFRSFVVAITCPAHGFIKGPGKSTGSLWPSWAGGPRRWSSRRRCCAVTCTATSRRARSSGGDWTPTRSGRRRSACRSCCYRDAGQCSALQGGGEGPRGRAARPERALAVRLVDSLSHGYGHDRGDTPAVTGDVGDAAVDGGVVQHFRQVLPQVAGPDFGSVAHTDDRTLRYTGVRAVAVQLPGLPDVGPAAVAGPGVRVRAGGVQRRAAGTAAGPRRWVAVPVGRGAVQAGHGGEAHPAAGVAGRGVGGRAPAGPGGSEHRVPQLLRLGHRQAQGPQGGTPEVAVPQGQPAGDPVHRQRPVQGARQRPAQVAEDRRSGGALVADAALGTVQRDDRQGCGGPVLRVVRRAGHGRAAARDGLGSRDRPGPDPLRGAV